MNYTEFGAKINPLVNRFNRAYNGDLLALVFKEVEKRGRKLRTNVH